jgi:hypothetical protein
VRAAIWAFASTSWACSDGEVESSWSTVEEEVVGTVYSERGRGAGGGMTWGVEKLAAMGVVSVGMPSVCSVVVVGGWACSGSYTNTVSIYVGTR